MKKPFVTVILSIEEASELLSCAGNGYGDGDFYENPDKETQKNHRAYRRAESKLRKARWAHICSCGPKDACPKCPKRVPHA